MRVSYRWLTQILGREIPLEDLLERLTMAGLEIESVVDLGVGSGKIVAARILTREQHPNADNLSLCDVSIGGETPLRIVCGAKNMGPGDLVPLAMEGAVLPNGMTIKKSKIRGEPSQGMMCSAGELGWSEDSDGLLLLPQEHGGKQLYREGEAFDALIDIKVTPNRPDCLSMYGIARDLAAALGGNFQLPPSDLSEEENTEAAKLASVRIDAPQACPRYLGRVIRNVSIAPSPLWLRRRVEAAGLRSINNVVDVTNYILVELGQPLHAFDLAKVSGGEVIVRYAVEGETTQTLDGQEVKLAATDLLIADREKPVALAGIMGCGNTEISAATTDVFLECAYFNPSTIRQTSKRLQKSSDSSYRFERGVDWSILEQVIDRAARLIADVAGGKVSSGRISVGPGPAPKPAIQLTAERVSSLLGKRFELGEITGPLQSLGFGVSQQDGHLQVQVPAHRPDVSRDADLVEEIARVRGYAEIPAALPAIRTRPVATAPETRTIQLVRSALQALGFLEAFNYSFHSSNLQQSTGLSESKAVKLENPLSAEYNLLRTSLLPGLLNNVVYNHNRGALDLRLFEAGKVFAADTSEPRESLEFAAVLTGNIMEANWRGGVRPVDFYDGKAAAEAILLALGIADASWSPATEECPVYPLLHPGKSAVAQVNGKTILSAGELHPARKATLELKRDAVLVHGTVEAILPLLGQPKVLQEIPQFPTITRDLALLADKSVAAKEIEAVVAKRAKSLLAGIRLFDVYEGERITEGKRSLAYQLRFAQPDRTLTDEEVNQVIERVLGDLSAKLGVELRRN